MGSFGARSGDGEGLVFSCGSEDGSSPEIGSFGNSAFVTRGWGESDLGMGMSFRLTPKQAKGWSLQLSAAGWRKQGDYFGKRVVNGGRFANIR